LPAGKHFSEAPSRAFLGLEGFRRDLYHPSYDFAHIPWGPEVVPEESIFEKHSRKISTNTETMISWAHLSPSPDSFPANLGMVRSINITGSPLREANFGIRLHAAVFPEFPSVCHFRSKFRDVKILRFDRLCPKIWIVRPLR
jgi:hypothetical protein